MRIILIYLAIIGLIVGCTATLIKVKHSVDTSVKTDSSHDSTRIGGGQWDLSDDIQIGGRKSKDTIERTPKEQSQSKRK